MDKGKRERSANFTVSERDILVSLVQKYESVLENKQSDASTWKKKEAVWESIQNEFNARSGGVFRSYKTLKVKYEGLKRTVRKKSAAIRSELYRTGGGKNTAPPLDTVEEHIKSMISLSADGLESIYDSDVLSQTLESQDGFSVLIDAEMVDNEATQNRNIQLDDTVITNECDSLSTTKTEILVVPDVEIKHHILQESVNDTVLLETPVKKYTAAANMKWDATSRRNLKSRKHPALSGNSQKGTVFDELTQAKLELINLQKGLLESEIIEKRKEWEFREKERSWKEEEYKLRLEKLRKELNE